MIPVALSLGGMLLRVAALAVAPQVIRVLTRPSQAEAQRPIPVVAAEQRTEKPAPVVCSPPKKVQIPPPPLRQNSVSKGQSPILRAWWAPRGSRGPPSPRAGSRSWAYLHPRSYPVNRIDPSGLQMDSPSAAVEQTIATGNIEEVVFLLEALGPSAGTASFRLLQNYRAAATFLRTTLSRAPKFDCHQVAMAVSSKLSKLGIAHRLITIQASGSYMYWQGRLYAERGFHQAIQIGNMVYDKLTGPAGMNYDQYMQIIRAGSDGARVLPP